jgi:hypothetical protein
MQRLQVVARGLVLVHAGQPIAEQRALDKVPGRGAGAFQIDGGQGVVDLAVEAEGAAGHGDALRFGLRLVADSLVGGHGVEHASLRAGQVQLLNGFVVEAQRVVQACAGPSTASKAARAPRARPGAR